MAVTAQIKNYETAWKNIDKILQDGKIQTANIEIKKIISSALLQKNTPEYIKGVLFATNIGAETDEDSDYNSILFLDSMIAKANPIAKQILINAKAEKIINYYNQNSWRIKERTERIDELEKDIRTWSEEKIFKTAIDFLKQSLEPESLLSTTSISTIDNTLDIAAGKIRYLPTVFDFLAHRSIEFLNNIEYNYKKPTNPFLINDEIFFTDAASFVKQEIKTSDTNSPIWNQIIIYQRMLKNNLTKNDKDVLVDMDLNRLKFINEKFSGKKNTAVENFKKALYNLEKNINPHEATARPLFEIATLEWSKTVNENYTAKNKISLEKALNLFKDIVTKYPTSKLAKSAKSNITNITKPNYNVTTEKVNLINEPYRVLVNYTNINKIYIKILKVTNDQIEKINWNNQKKAFQSLLDLKPIYTNLQALVINNDYLNHSLEVAMPKLENGIYILMTSLDADFSLSKNIVCLNTFHVSNLAAIYNSNNIFILDRKTGQPISNAKVQLWENVYDYKTYKSNKIKNELLVSNQNGKIILNNNYKNSNFVLEIKTNNDELFLQDEYIYINQENNINEIQNQNIHLYTDRSIYRPGQKVYFKGIVSTAKNKTHDRTVLANKTVTIDLKDANYQIIKTLKLTTNDFGSVNGYFDLPLGGLTGNFYMEVQDYNMANSTIVKVEEYKRPKFFVTIDKPKNKFKLSDYITIEGKAEAYAGNNIEGALVKYRVTRNEQKPYWHYYSNYYRGGGGWPDTDNNKDEITFGEAKTDANGKFKISFKADADGSIDESKNPIFIFNIIADITDVNGETRSAEQNIIATYHSLKLNINGEESIKANQLNDIKITTTNTNDEFIASKVIIKIEKLKENNILLRKRYWAMPDKFLMTLKEYKTLFPFDDYKDEANPNTWEIETTQTFNILSKKEGDWNTNLKLNVGTYKFYANTTTPEGKTINTERIFKITDNVSASNNEAIVINTDKEKYEPLQDAIVTVKGKLKNVILYQTKSFEKNNIETIKLDPKYIQKYSITEKDFGGIHLGAIGILNNSIYSQDVTIMVPWYNKDLEIKFETFRNKLEPGSLEKYKIKISNKNLNGEINKGQSAEILATMYDASLDQYYKHDWQKPADWFSIYNNIYFNNYGFSTTNSNCFIENNNEYAEGFYVGYDRLKWYTNNNRNYRRKGMPGGAVQMESRTMSSPSPTAAQADNVVVEAAKVSVSKMEDKNGVSGDFKKQKEPIKKENNTPSPETTIRKNFNETAFFKPEIKTDSAGNAIIEYTLPESLTTWKLMTLAHTKDMATGLDIKTLVAQKKLMVQPNLPRFLREGDRMDIAVKIVNLDSVEITGQAQLLLTNTSTQTSVDGWFKNMIPNQYFTVAAGQSTLVQFPIEVPYNFNSLLTYKIIATTNKYSDGEENALPILTNRQLVTESQPITIYSGQTKKYEIKKLISQKENTTATNEKITVEITTNPAWYAVLALPYMMEYPYECAEQTFSRAYANLLGANIIDKLPKIKTVFNNWKNADTSVFISQLSKNQELKNALLEETPWVLESQNEATQRKNIALLFDLNKIASEVNAATKKLKEMQSPNGGFMWFKGGPDDRYITQYIVSGIGHLQKLGIVNDDMLEIANAAIPYLDNKMEQDYLKWKKSKTFKKDNNLGSFEIQYLYARSYFNNPKSKSTETVIKYLMDLGAKNWLQQSKYMQAMLALSMHRNNDTKTVSKIIISLKEFAIRNEELGMYWKEFTTSGMNWYQAPIESQALIIELFSDLKEDTKLISDLKNWLIRQKQTQNWKSTRATAEACYALLLNDNNNIIETNMPVTVQLGSEIIDTEKDKTTEGLGYLKKSFAAKDITTQMGKINVTAQKTNQTNPAYGGVYWQYFDDLDKITASNNYLQITKQLYKQENTTTGPKLILLKPNETLKVGDKVKIRIIIKTDRAMEYVHLKDQRAAAFEPKDVLSEYKYQDGLGYYQTTKDLATHFFISYLPRNTFVFEYEVFVTHNGKFSNGITSIECMYAPEYRSNSEGVMVTVGE